MSIGIRLRLIEQWQIVWKKWSVRFNTIGVLLLSYLSLAPDAIVNIWSMMPDDVRSLIPVKFSLYIPLAMFILGLISNYIKQEKLERERLARELDNGTPKND